jgi:hypothetical protein
VNKRADGFASAITKKVKHLADAATVRDAYRTAREIIDSGHPYLVSSIANILLDWIVLPDESAPGQAEYNVEVLLRKARQHAAQQAAGRDLFAPIDPNAKMFAVTMEELRAFAQLVRADAINQSNLNKDQS